MRHGLPMEEGLKLITINAAKILGIDKQVGTIEVGKDADLTIYQGNPMEVLSHCVGTIIQGKVCYDARSEKSKE